MKVLKKVVNRNVTGNCNLCGSIIELTYQEFIETGCYGLIICCPACNNYSHINNPIDVCEYDDGTVEEYVI